VSLQKKSFIRRLSSFDDDLNFRKAFKIGLIVSAVLIVLSLTSLATRGLNLGIDFKGGAVWELTAPKLSADDARSAVADALDESSQDVTVQSVGRNDLRIETGPQSQANRLKVTTALAKVSNTSADDISVSTVGPSWGSQVSNKALKALFFFFIAVAGYISLRLEPRMAAAAIVAVIHDIIISVGVYSLLGLEVTPGTVIAFLTILGYSLYDTIVVFDKLKDNVGHLGSSGRYTYTDMANLSLNQTMMRSINTTLTALLPVISILLIGAVALGAVTLEEFGLALLVGLFVGAYSSIFVATPVLVFLKEREPRYAALRKKIEDRGVARSGTAADAGSARLAGAGTGPDADLAEATSGGGVATATATKPRPASGAAKSAPGAYSANHPPRPRKKGKKR